MNMIPKQAIDKAIEGGWMLSHVENESEIPSAIRFYMSGKEWTKIALDPTFWQALGKALGWNDIEPVSTIHMTLGKVWQQAAHRFYNLHLTGGDTDKFWQELLAN